MENLEAIKDHALMSVILNCTGTTLGEELAQYTAIDLIQGKATELEKMLSTKNRHKLAAAVELGRRAVGMIGPMPVISCPAEIVPYLQDIKGEQKEHFVCLYLNARNQVVHKELISIGSLSASIVHPREVFAAALKCEAGVASIILAHNHPSGDTTHSSADLDLTRRLVNAGQVMGIEVLDHIIISVGEFASLKEKGLM